MRRDFLKQCAAAGLGLSAPCYRPATAIADERRELPPYTGPCYLVLNASGGWDTTMLMDPKGVGGINRLYTADQIQQQGQHRFAPTEQHRQGGLSNENFYAEFGPELLVLNGLDYSVNNHSPCARYMATGKLDSLAWPTFAALVAACQGPDCPLAFLTFGNYSATGNLVAMSRVPYLPSLQRIANADAIEGNPKAPYHDDFALNRIEQAMAERRKEREQSPLLPRSQHAESMLYAAQVNSKALSRVVPHIPKDIPKQRIAQQAEIALASFRAGVCVSANLSIGQFDSHASNDTDQMKLIPELLEGIACILHRAESLQIRERLVLVVQSEMGRTPNYNSGNGKDHWSIGSVMFLGPGIRGNRVIGKTDDGQFAVKINPKTLEPQPDTGLLVRPEHIHEALRKYAGIDHHPSSLKFPLGISDPQRLEGLWG
ncbi:MAG: DUF1501 domain-containing protein [Planctomycetota bacterium]